MFDKQRYLTRGIQEKVSIPLQVALWRMIEKVDKELDYLQIFEIKPLTGILKALNAVQEWSSQEP